VAAFSSIDAYAENPSQASPELVLQTGHGQGINCVVFSHDGRRVASASVDHTIDIWDIESGLEIRTFTGHSGEVTAAAFSPDGKLLASGGEDNNVKIWDAATGRELFNLPTGDHPLGVEDVNFDPSGTKLISLNQDRTVITWDVATGQELNRFSAGGTSGHARFTDLTPDARWVMSDRYDQSISREAIEVWNVSTGEKKYSSLTKEDMELGRVSPDGRWLVYTDDHLLTGLWDIAKGAVAWTIPGNPAIITHGSLSFAFSPDAKVLAADDMDYKAVRLIDVATGKVLRTFQQSSGSGLRFSDDGRLLAAADGRNIVILDSETGKVVRDLSGSTRSIGALAISGDGRMLAVQNFDDNSVYLWDLKLGRQVRSLLSGETNVGMAAVALSRDGRLVAAQFTEAGTSERKLSIRETATGKELLSFPKLDYISSLSFSPDGTMLAAGDYLGGMKVWDIASAKDLVSIDNRAVINPRSKVAFSADGHWLAVVGSDSVLVWDAVKRDWASSLQTRYVTALAISSDGKRIATADLFTHSISVWDPEDGGKREVFIPGQGSTTSLAISPDSQWLASASEDHLVHLWNLATGEEIRQFAGHGGEVKGVAFTPDGRWLISGGAEGSIRIWDPSTGANVAILSTIGGSSDWVAITPKGLFDGSPAGTKQLVAWRVGDRVLAASQFYTAYSTPGLLAQVLSGTAIEPAVSITGLRLPPSVRLSPPSGDRVVPQPQVTVTVVAQDEGGGVAEVRLYQNGKLAAARLARPGEKAQFTFEVTLVPGEDNVLRAVALGTDGVESSPDEVTLLYEAPSPPKPALYVFAVGINDYEDRSLHLDFAQPDAQALVEFFRSHGNLFSSVNVTQLFNKDASKTAIQSALEELAGKVKPEDVALFYFAGHGMLVAQNFYFLPEDMKKDPDLEAAVQRDGIPASALGEALLRIKAVKQVLILDACQSESALPALAKATFQTRGLEKPEDRAVRMLAHANGIYLIAASTAQQFAYEVPELGHGVFTSAVLAGLGERGEPQALTPAGMVTVISLINYVARAVPELTEKYHMGEPQTPVIFDAGTDIPLTALSASNNPR
jgi:WD40 repeat protein